MLGLTFKVMRDLEIHVKWELVLCIWWIAKSLVRNFNLQGVWSLNMMHSLLKVHMFVAVEELVCILEVTQEKAVSSLEDMVETMAMSAGKQWSEKQQQPKDCVAEVTGGTKGIQTWKQEGLGRGSKSIQKPKLGSPSLNLNNKASSMQCTASDVGSLYLKWWCQDEMTASWGYQSHK